MIAATKSLFSLTAADVMTPDGLQLTENMPLREAARLMIENHVSGAPVLDGEGKCVGVLSTTDFLRHALSRADITNPLAPPLPMTCSFQTKHREPNGEEVTLCSLPPGVCPVQLVRKATPGGETSVICRQPHCVLVDWQIVNYEHLPKDAVRNYMTADPVTVSADTPIRTLARMMIDAHIHRLVVVDDAAKPMGIVSTIDVLAALAYAEDKE